MSKLIPQTFIDDLLTRIDIVEIIGSRIKLRKTGNNFSALCPFHSEKTPSFTVSHNKQFYHCFGCGAHGSAINFLMQFEHLEFPEAIENLASLAGLIVPKSESSENKTRFTELYHTMDQVANHYQKELKKCTQAINYLKTRGLTGEICKYFGIGYASSNWNNLLKVHQNSQQLKSQLITTGLLIEKNQQTYARFRDRIMFPIRDRRGQIIGFGGRTLGDDPAKYINSPETPLYHKGQELYGLYEAKRADRKTSSIIVVEGYLDVVALAQYEIKNVVATLGTAITTKQIQQLLRNTSEITFCFDGDNAGRGAAWRALENILPIMRDGISANFLFLPEGNDPDDLVRKEGKDAFLKRLPTAIPLADFFFLHLSNTVDINSIAGRAHLAKEAKNLLQKMPHSIFQQLLVNKLAELVQLEVSAIDQLTITKAKTPSKTDSIKIHSNIQLIITILLHHPQLIEYLDNVDKIAEIDAPGIDLLINLIKLLKSQPSFTIGAILENWRGYPDVSDLLSTLAAKAPIIPANSLKNELLGSIQLLYQYQQELLIQKLLQKASVCELTKDEKMQLQKLIASSKTSETLQD